MAGLLWHVFTHLLLLVSPAVGGDCDIAALLLIACGALLLINFITNIFLNIFTNILSNINALVSSFCFYCDLTDIFKDIFTFNFINRSTELLWSAGALLSLNINTLRLLDGVALRVGDSVKDSSALLLSSVYTDLFLLSVTVSLGIFIAEFSVFLLAVLFSHLHADLRLHGVAMADLLRAAHLLLHCGTLLLISGSAARLWSRSMECGSEHIRVL